MTTKQPGRCVALVTDIKNAYKTRGEGRYIHLVTFAEDNGSIYQAEEQHGFPVSKFVKNVRNIFDVQHPGRNGGLDWVQFAGLETNGKPVINGSRDDMIVAQCAFHGSVQLGLQRGWNEDEIIERAHRFAGEIKLIAKQIAAELI